MRLGILVACLFILACGGNDDGSWGKPGSDGGGGSGVQPGDPIAIYLKGAVIGPAKTNGSAWDTCKLDSSAVAQVISAVTTGATFNAVVSLLQSSMFSALCMPDPEGTATLYVDGMAHSSVPLRSTSEDTFTPQWIGSPGWTNVPYSNRFRINVSLKDTDIFSDDVIGTADINQSHFKTALDKQEVVQVNVSSQSSNQILFIGISVYAQ